DDRRVDRGQLAQGQAAEGHDAEHDEQQAHHRGEHGPPDRDVGEPHSPASATTLPSRSLPVPSTTIRSPASRPDRTSTSPAWRLPSVTGARSTWPPSPTRQANESLPTCTIAISGATSASRPRWCRRTST